MPIVVSVSKQLAKSMHQFYFQCLKLVDGLHSFQHYTAAYIKYIIIMDALCCTIHIVLSGEEVRKVKC